MWSYQPINLSPSWSVKSGHRESVPRAGASGAPASDRLWPPRSLPLAGLISATETIRVGMTGCVPPWVAPTAIK